MSSIYCDIIRVFDGSSKSGNYGHLGRPGKVGGSAENPVPQSSVAKMSKSNKKYLDSDVLKDRSKHSIGKYLTLTGRLKPERQELHKKIIQNAFKGVKQTRKPVIYFNGGGTASGKSTALKSLVPDAPNENNKLGVVIDPDEIKKLIPEYQEMIKNGQSGAAAYAHEESSALAKQTLALALKANRYNVLMDGTLGGDLEKTRNKIRAAKTTGNPVVGNFVTIDYDEALKRSYKRFLDTGRFPNVDDTLKIHQGVSNNFPELFKEFDGGKLIDNNGKKPKLIAEFKDGELKIKDKAAYQKFIEKQRLTKSDIKRLKNNLKKNIERYNREWLKENPGKTLRKPLKID